MNTTNVISISTIERPNIDLALSPEASEMIQLGRDHSWGFRVLGQAPMPERPARVGDWLIVPANLDSTQVPTRTLNRVQAIFEAGIRPEGFVLVHEAPLLLPAPKEAPPKVPLEEWKVAPSPNAISGTDLLDGFAKIISAVFSVIGSLLLPALALGLLALDPILVAVTEDGYWIEIDRWQNPSTT